MANIAFKIYYMLFRAYLYVLFNINHRLYMKHYIPFLKSIGIKVKGAPRYINYKVSFDSTDNFSLIELNDNCVITGSTAIITHDYSIFHASIGCNNGAKTDPEFRRTGKVVVGENAFIGMNCIILPDVVVGKNAIVGAGSVVTKDVPENTVVAGNPARPIETVQEYFDKTYPKIEGIA